MSSPPAAVAIRAGGLCSHEDSRLCCGCELRLRSLLLCVGDALIAALRHVGRPSPPCRAALLVASVPQASSLMSPRRSAAAALLRGVAGLADWIRPLHGRLASRRPGDGFAMLDPLLCCLRRGLAVTGALASWASAVAVTPFNVRHARLAVEPVNLGAATEDVNDAAGGSVLAVVVVLTAPVPLLTPWPLPPVSAATFTTVLAPVTAPLRCSLFRASSRRRAGTLLFSRAAAELVPAKAEAGLLRDEVVCRGGGAGGCWALAKECWVPPGMGISTAVVAMVAGAARRMLCSRWRHREEVDDPPDTS